MKIFIILFVLFIPTFTLAGTVSGGRDILGIGCHKINTTCFVKISGDPVGPSSCSSTSIRWDAENESNGKIALTHLTTAFVSGKKVNFQVSDSCYVPQNHFPTFDWWTVY